MKLVYKIGENIKKSLDNIKLIDKCLIIFMMILMAQSIYNLFINEANLNGGDAIDILIRTTQASVFGYFLSANFIKKDRKINNNLDKEKKEVINNENITKKTNHDNSENAIDSISDNSKNVNNYISSREDKYNSKLKDNDEHDDYYETSTTEQQVVIITIVGIISLIAIIMVRDCNLVTTASAGTISQLRDFVSGSVGFLLGSPSKRNK